MESCRRSAERLPGRRDGHRFRHAAGLLICTGLLLPMLAACGGRTATPPPHLTSSQQVIGPGGEPGVYHQLDAGQTLYRLSIIYDVPLERILSLNRIDDPTDVAAGSRIFIPGARSTLPYPEATPARLSWPLRGPVTSGYGVPRGRRSHHAGLDIDGEQGDPIYAAASGRVREAGRGGSYGKYVLIDHGNGLQTLYAHVSRIMVKRGQRVESGDEVALVGQTGNARGTHLHFEVRRDGRAVDPLPFLRGQSPSRAANQ